MQKYQYHKLNDIKTNSIFESKIIIIIYEPYYVHPILLSCQYYLKIINSL